MNPTLSQAIAGRNVLTCRYNGGIRRVEPHCHGVARTGREALRAYQVSGHSNSGKPVDWKFLTVAKMRDIRVLDETFPNNRPGYVRGDRHMIRIYKEL